MSTDERDGAEEFSAGGVVVDDESRVIVIVPVKRAFDGRRVLGLPKGHLDGDETAEQAARREVAEETGVRAS
jgi:8-oxo-dGTP pyrophosphatase MutT (NUDIX family)